MQPGSSPLDQLADIHLPDSVNWWPLAPGWWLLIGVILITLVVILWWRKRIASRQYRQYAAELLQTAYAQYQTDRQGAVYLQQFSQLLRRVARTSYGFQFDTTIKGEAWLDWLDATCPELKSGFATGAGRLLLSGPYQKNLAAELEPLHQLGLQWIHQHCTAKALMKRHAIKKNVSAETTDIREVRQHV